MTTKKMPVTPEKSLQTHKNEIKKIIKYKYKTLNQVNINLINVKTNKYLKNFNAIKISRTLNKT